MAGLTNHSPAFAGENNEDSSWMAVARKGGVDISSMCSRPSAGSGCSTFGLVLTTLEMVEEAALPAWRFNTSTLGELMYEEATFCRAGAKFSTRDFRLEKSLILAPAVAGG